jgi:hypothetical protein
LTLRWRSPGKSEPVERFQKIIPDKVTLDSVLSDADVIFSAQGTFSEMTLDHFVMVRIHARQ